MRCVCIPCSLAPLHGLPLLQIIWTMLSQLARFSLFLVVLMTSFALTFHALFYACGDDVDTGESFGSFTASLLTTFAAMLGNFDFDVFKAVPECGQPKWAYDVGVIILVVYEILMAILLLNLLIAVLSTAHAKVYANDKKEFNLARTKLILYSSRNVATERLPPPLILLKAVLGIVVDTGHTLYVAASKCRWVSRNEARQIEESSHCGKSRWPRQALTESKAETGCAICH